MSHSQVLEWISGSFLQSHRSWQMLWPSSMFWMLLATASAVVPSTQPALPLLAPIASRAATRGIAETR